LTEQGKKKKSQGPRRVRESGCIAATHQGFRVAPGKKRLNPGLSEKKNTIKPLGGWRGKTCPGSRTTEQDVSLLFEKKNKKRANPCQEKTTREKSRARKKNEKPDWGSRVLVNKRKSRARKKGKICSGGGNGKGRHRGDTGKPPSGGEKGLVKKKPPPVLEVGEKKKKKRKTNLSWRTKKKGFSLPEE